MFRAPNTDPLKVFIHVPKTAGSTVNAHLTAWAKGQDHAEHFVDKQQTLLRRLPRLSWISGHLALNKMRSLLEGSNRPLQMYGLIREPISQIASHYNWLIEIGHRGGRFFASHAPGIKDFSTHLRECNNDDPAIVIANIEAKQGLFLNLQSRFLLGDDLKFSENTGRDRLSEYTVLSNDPDALTTKMTGTCPTIKRYENASGYHFDRAVFETDELQEFLHRRHRFDMQLYARIAARG